jgi:hypothetical protein
VETFPVVLNHLKVNNTAIESTQDIANTLGSTISRNIFFAHYVETFRRFNAAQENRPISFNSDHREDYNKPFSELELTKLLAKLTTRLLALTKYITSS